MNRQFREQAETGSLRRRGQGTAALRHPAGLAKQLVAFVTEERKTEPEVRDADLQRRNAELARAVHERTTELRRMHARVLGLERELQHAAQHERRRLATELHDHLQQLLVLGKMKLGQSQRFVGGVPECERALQEVDEVLSEALTYSRTLVAERSQPVGQEQDLVASLRELSESMKRYDQTVTMIAPKAPRLSLSENERRVLIQSVRELLINSAKHAGTGQVRLTLALREGALSLTVSDEGKGCNLASQPTCSPISSQFGLLSVAERMTALGGSLTMATAPGQGTTATLVCPLTRGAVGHQLRRS